MAVGVFGARKAKQQQALETQHPSEPWVYREEWARGEVKSTGKAALVFVGAFAILWNAISGAVFFGILAQPNHGNAIYLVLIFPLVGVVLLVWAIRQMLRWRRFGQSIFKMSTIPGVVGGPLAGVIHSARPLYRAGEIRLRLACIERDSSGDHTSENLQWDAEKILSGDVLQSGEGIPVLFNVPFDCKPTATLGASRSIVWRLEVKAAMPGTDFAAQFEVPLFKTAQSRADAPAIPDPAAAYEKPIEPTLVPGIAVNPASSGGTEFVFGAARNKSMGFGLAFFTAIWTGAIVLMIKLKAPMVFGLFDVLLLLGLIGIWTSASRVVADSSGLRVTSRWCFVPSNRVVPAAEVQSVEPKLSISSGAVTYYDLIAITNGGKKVKLASSIKGKKESEWLAREIQNALSRK